jgi:DnaJ-class molecular chaperone
VSLAYRLWRATRRQILLRLGMLQGAAFEERRGRPTARPHPLAAEYRLLGAPLDADPITLRRCWRAQVRLYHPDRYAHDPVAQRHASAHLRQVNESYQRILRSSRSTSPPNR